MGKTDNLYQILFQQSMDGVFIINYEGQIIEANDAMLNMVGHTRRKIKNMTTADFLGGPDIPIQAAKLLKQQESVKDLPLRVRHKNGTFIDVLCTITVQRGKDGRIENYLGVVRDVTEQQRTETALRQSEKKLSHLVQQSPLGFIEWNQAFEVVAWNSAAEKIFGHTHQQALGQHVRFIIPPEHHEHIDAVWQGLLAQTGGTRSTNDNVTADGRRITCEWYNTPLVDAAGQVTGVASLIDNISERIQAEADLARSYRDIQAKAESIAVINRVTDVLYRSLTLEVVVEQATELVMNYTNAPLATLYSLDAEADTFILLVAKGGDDTLKIGSAIPVEGSLSGLAVANKTIITSDDLGRDKRAVKKLRTQMASQGFQSIINVPLLYQEQALGVINLLFDEKLRFPEQEHETLLSIGKAIGPAIANARYVAQTQAQVTKLQEAEVLVRQSEETARQFQQKLQALQEVTLELQRAPDLDTLYRQAIELGLQALGFERLGLILHDENQQRQQHTFGTNAKGEVVDERHLTSELRGRLLDLISSKGLNAFHEDADLWDMGEIVAKGWNAVAGLWEGDKGIGWLATDNLLSGTPPPPYLIDILTLYAEALGHLIGRKRDEEAARQFQGKLQTLQEVGLALSRSDTTDELYQQVINLGREQLGFDRLGLLLYDPATNMITGTFGTDDEGHLRDERHFKQEMKDPAVLDNFHHRKRFSYWEGKVLLDEGRPVGKGWNAMSALWYEDTALGYLVADNLLKHEPLAPYQLDLLALYADTLAHVMVRLQAEQTLRVTRSQIEEREALLRLVLDTIPQAVFWKDRNSVYLGSNQNFANDAGVASPEMLIGKTDYDFTWSKEEADIFHKIDREVMESNKPLLGIVESQVRPDGKRIWSETNKAPLHDGAGNVIGILGAYGDITDRIETEERLQASQQRLAILIQQSPLAVIEWDLDFQVKEWNLAAERVFGYTRDEVLGQHARLIIPPEDHAHVDAVWAGLLSQTGGSTSKNSNVTKDGRIITCEWFNTPLIDEKGEVIGVASLVQDITDRERLQAEVQESLTRREREVALSTQIAQEIASATDLSDLYQRVVTQIQEQFGYYHTQLLRYDPAMQSVGLTVGYGMVGEKMLAMNHSVPIGVGLVGKAAETGKSLLRPDLTDDPDHRPNPLLPATKGELAVPIKLRNEVLGILDVQSDTIGALNENDQLVLNGLSGQIAVAIESTTLRQEMEARLRELNVLQRQMTREGWREYKSVRQQHSGYQFSHGGVQPVTPELPTPTNGNKRNGRHQKTPAALPAAPTATPLQIRGETIGILGVQDDPLRPLSNEETLFLTAVAKEVAEALEAARLFEQTQDSLSEQERLTAELETVAQVSTAAATILEADALLQAVVDLTKSSFNLYHVHIYLLNETGRILILKAGAGNVGRLMTLEGREINIDAESLICRAARTRQGVLENNVRKTVDFLPHPLLPNTQAEMAVPMIVGDKLIGVLDLQSDQVEGFTAEDLKIQKTLASQIAIAMENARQYADQVETSAKLREVDRLKSEFLASMSHELRTPLNSIIGFADVLLEGLDGDLNERMEEDVRLIRESGRHLRELIGEILDMSKIESGRMELRYEDVDLRQMAQDIMATAASLAQEKNLDMYLDLGDEISTIQVDRTRLRQILWNIMGNAIKFTEKGSVSLSMHDKGDRVLIAIRDTGIGIKEENTGIVFEQFRQIDGGLNRAATGTGLGMPITKKLVELHGGDIWIESVYGQGSTFFFTLPYTPPISKPGTGPLPSL